MSEILESPYKVAVPPVDLATFVFTGLSEDERSQPQYFNAEQPEQSFSLNQAKVLVKRLALGLRNLGLQPNDKVLLYAGNSLYFPVLFWGTVAARCVFTGCSPSASVTELAYQLKDSDAVLLVTSSATALNARKAATEVGLRQDRIYAFLDLGQNDDISGLPSWTSIWSSAEEVAGWEWNTFASPQESKCTTAVINYSSGTTGVPKGVEITHYNIISNSLQVIFKRNMVADTTRARERSQRLKYSGERWLAPLPMFHAYGQAYYCTTAARTGVKVYIMPTYSIEKYLLYLDVYRITFLTGVPTLLVQLSKHPIARSFNLKSIESVVTGSAPLDPRIGRLVEHTHLRPGVQVKQGWGMTETTCSATGFAPDDIDDGKSIGWLNPNVSAKIVPVNQDFRSSDEIPYTVGEIWVSGPNIMKGYYKRFKETAEAIVHEDGRRWLRTGDVGYADSRGYFYIVDRMKELIKVKGLQVAPAEIELLLVTHPGIAEAAVIGEKGSEGEYPKAFVVKAPGADINSEDVQSFVRQQLSRHKWLTAGVQFIESIPRTPSGKIIRRALQNVNQSTVNPKSAKI